MTDATNVTTGKPKVGGAVFSAKVGAELPKDTKTVLDTKFKSLGYCSDDGFTNSNSPESDNTKAWGGDTVLTQQTSKEDTFKIKLLEVLNPDVLKVVYNEDNVTGALDTGLTIKVNNDELEDRSWVIDMIMKGPVAKRIVIPCAKITEIGDIVYKDNEPVGYELTLTATPDADGQTHYEYMKKGN